ncbi:glycine--tRNA ligase subunit beta [Pseudorhodoferax sp. Leaf267]|uniref:glycine--tRNA ligase subunit beta n=1 Tax=Pseudorhodoferax sp. Leaf267 TaxID=1736316 RepID=UPI0006F63140|nr:glycine--tRNA ligase subunit beta [Pseudorhodoferax sp. Leaf267]KQP14204.1 glycine--tRNA ligase subunit beta [Pseudorhodoferax sp. Leaf267]
MTAQNLLVELFVEELPPKALRKLGDAFGGQLLEQLKAQGLAGADAMLTTFASPRRLAAHVTAVLARAADKPQSQKLMPVAVGLDAAGQPTPALLKRLAALGADASAVPLLQRRPDGKAEALFHDSIAPGVSLVDGLQKALLDAIAKLPIPKVMGYQLESGCELPGWTTVSFVRPAHGLVALHGSEVVPVQALGLNAGNTTQGHRFEASQSPVVLPDADSYADVLARDGAVIAGFDARKGAIVQQLAAAAAQVGGGARAIEDDALLDEVTALVERPNVLVCSFEPEFLEVPQECLILTMKANQKYFPLLDAAGKLTNKFLVVSNISPADASAVIGGNERVVRPRLADAKFFFDQDRKRTLASRVDSLGKVVYHNKLGTQGERVERVRSIARAIAQQLGGDALAQAADTAATLAKTDLVTDMVGEFPELQGTMGRYYALHDGLPADVADAIEDHYKPRFAGDSLPRNPVGIAVALADKLETLAGMFGIGNLPTGDKDPFALRRHALGVARMLVESRLALSASALTRMAFDAFPPGLVQDAAAALDDFMVERLKGSLRDGGYSAAEVDAAIHAQQLGDWSTIPSRLAAVRAFAALPEAPALAAANKRIANILKKAGEVDAHVSEVLLREPAEQALFAAMNAVVPQADAQFQAGDYTASLQTLAALRAPVDAFFDGVMVNADEPDLRLNRQGLLKSLHAAMNRVADLSRLAS